MPVSPCLAPGRRGTICKQLIKHKGRASVDSSSVGGWVLEGHREGPGSGGLVVRELWQGGGAPGGQGHCRARGCLRAEWPPGAAVGPRPRAPAPLRRSSSPPDPEGPLLPLLESTAPQPCFPSLESPAPEKEPLPLRVGRVSSVPPSPPWTEVGSCPQGRAWPPSVFPALCRPCVAEWRRSREGGSAFSSSSRRSCSALDSPSPACGGRPLAQHLNPRVHRDLVPAPQQPFSGRCRSPWLPDLLLPKRRWAGGGHPSFD